LEVEVIQGARREKTISARISRGKLFVYVI
jgi:hypothetical protein